MTLALMLVLCVSLGAYGHNLVSCLARTSSYSYIAAN